MTDLERNLDQRRALLQQLHSLQHAGVLQLPKPTAAALTQYRCPRQDDSDPARIHAGEEAPAARDPQPPTMPEQSDPSPAAALKGNSWTLAERTERLEVLQQHVAACTRCTELAGSRTQTVFGVGNFQARLCFLGEAPGADEDRQGEPFVGRAGKLLTDMIEKGMGLRRQNVYILNVIKCRPPGNRNPLPDEIENCRGYLEQQLEIIQPEFICCLGAVAAQNLLQTNASIGRLRGKLYDWRGVRVAVTYHPAYLLRTAKAKALAWEDIQLLMREMGLPLPRRESS